LPEQERAWRNEPGANYHLAAASCQNSHPPKQFSANFALVPLEKAGFLLQKKRFRNKGLFRKFEAFARALLTEN
jgi:hypothetical protein